MPCASIACGFDAMSELSRSVTIEAPAERVFAYVDDIRNLARHMSESGSMPMMGSKLKLEIMTPQPTGVGAVYRYSGRNEFAVIAQAGEGSKICAAAAQAIEMALARVHHQCCKISCPVQ